MLESGDELLEGRDSVGWKAGSKQVIRANITQVHGGQEKGKIKWRGGRQPGGGEGAAMN